GPSGPASAAGSSWRRSPPTGAAWSWRTRAARTTSADLSPSGTSGGRCYLRPARPGEQGNLARLDRRERPPWRSGGQRTSGSTPPDDSPPPPKRHGGRPLQPPPPRLPFDPERREPALLDRLARPPHQGEVVGDVVQ